MLGCKLTWYIILAICVSAQDWTNSYGRPGHTNFINDLALIPEKNQFVSCSDDGSVAIWSLHDGKLVRKFAKTNYFALSCQVAGTRLIGAFLDALGKSVVSVWNHTNGILMCEFTVYTGVYRMRVINSSIFVATGDNLLNQYDLINGSLIDQLTDSNNAGFIRSDITADGRFVFSARETVRRYDMQNKTEFIEIPTPSYPNDVMIVNANGVSFLMATTTSGTIYQFNMTDFTLLRTFYGSEDPTNLDGIYIPQRMNLAPKSILILNNTLYTTVFGYVWSWSLDSSQSNRTLILASVSDFMDMTLYFNNSFIVSCSSANLLIYRNASRTSLPTITIDSGDRIKYLAAVTSTDRPPLFIYSTYQNTIVMWDSGTDQLVDQVDTAKSKMYVDAIAVVGTRLYTGFYYHNVTEHDIGNGSLSILRRTFDTPDSAASLVSYIYPYEDSIFVCSTLTLEILHFNLTSEKLIHRFSGHAYVIYTLRVVNDLLISASFDSDIRVWSLSTGQLVRSFPRIDYYAQALAIIGDSVFLGVLTGSIYHFDLVSNNQIQVIDAHIARISSMVEVGQYFFSCSMDGVIKMWRVQGLTVSHMKTFLGHRMSVTSLVLADGALYSGSMDGTIKRWEYSGLIVPEPRTSTTRRMTTTSRKPTSRSVYVTEPDIEPENLPLVDSSAASIVIGLGVSFALIAIGIGAVFFWKRRRRERLENLSYPSGKLRKSTKSAQSRQKIRATSTTSQTQSSIASSQSHYSSRQQSAQVTAHFTTVVDKTVMDKVTTHELSIPAFLQMKWGLDFRQDVFLAKGGGGEVYFATALNNSLIQRSQGQPLVLKRIADTFIGLSENNRAAFYQELALMWKYRDHPNFVKVFAYAMEPTCTVMKFYALGDLDSFIDGSGNASRSFRYSKLILVDLFRQLCNGIAFMHLSGIAHCDVKPANALLDRFKPPDWSTHSCHFRFWHCASGN